MTSEGVMNPAEMNRRNDVRRRYGNLAMSCDEGSLSCGNPFSLVDLKPGERVLDLGSGTGSDVLISAKRVGPAGRVWGLDMTPAMLDQARARALESGATNIEFLEGYIEEIPLPDASVDVVISNCVIVLSAKKSVVFTEIARVLAPGGRVGITDLILERGATADPTCCDQPTNCGEPVDADSYRRMLSEAGLVGVSIEPTHTYAPGIASAAVRAERPLASAPGYTVRHMAISDWPRVAAIYAAGIASGHATFESDVPDWESWDGSHLAAPRLVAVDASEEVVGWAAGSAVSERCVYGGVMEHSIYVDTSARGRGVGDLLLNTLIVESERLGFWTIQSGVFPENLASLALHRKWGFREVGRRERVGRHNGVWRDVVLLERRSPVVE
jgi:L-amino acid N-acyltransferase YncA/2-polyprenyl-3-methyl-5-hydroxy-6-metoxy-1,4-benzoquinol methylase